MTLSRRAYYKTRLRVLRRKIQNQMVERRINQVTMLTALSPGSNKRTRSYRTIPRASMKISQKILRVVSLITMLMMQFRAVTARMRHSQTRAVLTLAIRLYIMRTRRKTHHKLGEVELTSGKKKAQKILNGTSCSSDRSPHLWKTTLLCHCCPSQ